MFTKIDDKVVHALKAVKRPELKLGLISNCTPEEAPAWHTCCLAEIFDDAVFSWQIGHAKPELGIYTTACDRLSVKPAQSLFVGDRGSDELVGASRAGMGIYWCTWFLDRWPQWKRVEPGRENSSAFPLLRSPDQFSISLSWARNGAHASCH